MGNWNAEAGSGKEGKIVGSSGLEEREERGGKLVNWWGNKEMMITDTWFQDHPRRKYTYTSPWDRARNQIDIIN